MLKSSDLKLQPCQKPHSSESVSEHPVSQSSTSKGAFILGGDKSVLSARLIYTDHPLEVLMRKAVDKTLLLATLIYNLFTYKLNDKQ